MEESKSNYVLIPKEKNTQKRDLFITYRSNSQFHFDDKTPYNFDHRIKLNPSGEPKSLDLRNHFPTNQVRNSFIKSSQFGSSQNILSNETAYEKAEIELNINNYASMQRHQNLLRKYKKIKNNCHKVRLDNKKKLETKKLFLKKELTRIIKDALLFSKKNSAVRAMLPDNINEIVEKVKKETRDLSMTLNLSRMSRISKVSSIGMYTLFEKNDFLNSLGIDVENLNENNINIDIDKCWDYIVKISKGRSVEDTLRYKVVNVIMNLVEKKSSEKAKKIYEKLDIYKKYMAGKKRLEIERKEKEEEKKEQELRTNVKEFIKQKMYRSLSERKNFETEKYVNHKKSTVGHKKVRKFNKQKRAESTKVDSPENKKKFKKLNAYKDVSKIISFIDGSRKNSQSKVCRKHFENIKITKDMDRSLKKMKVINDIFK